jgi:diaminohydroxyphosphoribosylaminopyrimidine deaminase/5-amino-6-(5-phosphoribosylamino)uracil reductase
MQGALALARRGLGNVWPNPAVGCVIINDGRIVGRGWTQPGGRPHAETGALARAGKLARGATAYVTLEPCSHWGRTPPCADALLAAGLSRVVVAIADPDPRVSGAGIDRLRVAGTQVEVGLYATEAEEVNAGFFSRIQRRRPLVTLKLATSLDGRIATAAGESRWITGPAARERGHLLRASHDAILVGTGTAIADDPQLTCRLPGLAHRSPVRVVLDRQLRIPGTARFFAGLNDTPTWVITSVEADAAKKSKLSDRGVVVIGVGDNSDGSLDLAAVLSALAARGITRLLVEGGGRLAATLLARRLVDRLAWFHAPLALGGDGIPAVAAFRLGPLADAPGFERIATKTLGADVLTTFQVTTP